MLWGLERPQNDLSHVSNVGKRTSLDLQTNRVSGIRHVLPGFFSDLMCLELFGVVGLLVGSGSVPKMGFGIEDG